MFQVRVMKETATEKSAKDNNREVQVQNELKKTE